MAWLSGLLSSQALDTHSFEETRSNKPPNVSWVNSSFPWWITTFCRHKGKQRDKWHINKSFTGLREGSMESDVSFPRNPFIMITKSQMLGLLQNLPYNYVFQFTMWWGQPKANQGTPKSPLALLPICRTKVVSGLFEFWNLLPHQHQPCNPNPGMGDWGG